MADIAHNTTYIILEESQDYSLTANAKLLTQARLPRALTLLNAEGL